MTNPDPIARIAEHSADYVFGHYESVRPRDMFELALLHAALDAVTGAKAAIRAELAEEIAAAIEGLSESSYEPCSDERGALHEAAKVAREHAKS